MVLQFITMFCSHTLLSGKLDEILTLVYEEIELNSCLEN